MSSSRQQLSCAACKHQKRKCSRDCNFARHFPQERLQAFLDVHWLFGLSNVVKMYNSVGREQRDMFMESVILESEIRRRDPVHGCLGIVTELSTQLHSMQQELENVNHLIAFHKRCEQQKLLTQQQQQQQQQQFSGMKVKLEPTEPIMVKQERGIGESEASSSNLSDSKTEDKKSFIDLSKVKTEVMEDFSNFPIPKIEDVKPFGKLPKPKIENGMK